MKAVLRNLTGSGNHPRGRIRLLREYLSKIGASRLSRMSAELSIRVALKDNGPPEAGPSVILPRLRASPTRRVWEGLRLVKRTKVLLVMAPTRYRAVVREAAVVETERRHRNRGREFLAREIVGQTLKNPARTTARVPAERHKPTVRTVNLVWANSRSKKTVRVAEEVLVKTL